MKLAKASYDWAIRHLVRENDTDLFPLPIEIDAIQADWASLVREFEKLDLSNYTWRGGRRFVVPKGPLAFRIATQLDPVDSIVLSALLFEHGSALEASRLPLTDARAFSYRFQPAPDGRMYAQRDGWHEFWRASAFKTSGPRIEYVLVADISDFYNQIYHHSIERQFTAAKLSANIVKILQRYFQTLTGKESRGIPIGPHSSHILAECTLDALDRSLVASGVHHCRYVDDLHIFAQTQQEAIKALYTLMHTLDAQQRLVLQNNKTRIMPAVQFQELAAAMLMDNPISEREQEVLEIIRDETGGDPYTEVALSQLGADDLEVLDDSVLEDLVQAYLGQPAVDFVRLAWLIRRLTQVGAPGALEILSANLSALSPILGPVARYIMAAVPNYGGDSAALGEVLVAAMTTPIIAQSPYLQAVLIDVIARIPELNHVDTLTARYPDADQAVRRGILLAAGSAGRCDWLRNLKSEFRTMDPWCRRAFIKAAASLPSDEAKFWFDSVRDSLRPLESVVAKHHLPNVKVGEIRIGQE